MRPTSNESRRSSEVCTTSVEDDGIVFDPKTVHAARIKEDADDEGVRVTMQGKLGTARLDVQIELGFGDASAPGPIEVDFPTILAMPAPRIRAYPKETVVAEKLEAMVHLGLANSRMKDFFDLAFLARTFAFDGPTLAKAIGATFERRETALPDALPVGLTAEFYEDDAKRKQWKAFRSRIGAAKDVSLEDVVKALAAFLGPVLGGARKPEGFQMDWPAGGPWEAKERA